MREISKASSASIPLNYPEIIASSLAKQSGERQQQFAIDENLSISNKRHYFNHHSSTTTSSKRSSRASDQDNSTTPATAVNSPDEAGSPAHIDEKFDALEEFINVSLTPVECTIVCPSELVDLLFGRELRLLSGQSGVQIFKEEYLPIQIDGDGLDTGSRVLEVSYPLSTANIPIFFLPTYFSDYMLAPIGTIDRVKSTLVDRGFEFSESANSYVAASPTVNYCFNFTPESRAKFNNYKIQPFVDQNTRLLLTGARSSSSTDEAVELAIVRTLVKHPKYFSVSMTSGQISFLVDYETSQEFPEHALLGSTTDFVIPITLDLRKLPEDITGVVSGVASQLLDHSFAYNEINDNNDITNNNDNTQNNRINISYLSTAKSGVVMVSEDNINVAFEAFVENDNNNAF